jgi:hypothetical protein
MNDTEFIDAIYKWNLLFFEGRAIATHASPDARKYQWLIKHEDKIKEKALEYLNYWRDFKHSLYVDAMNYVTDNLRDFMESYNPPKKKKDNTNYNKTPLIYD